jgi:hypothetical protein
MVQEDELENKIAVQCTGRHCAELVQFSQFHPSELDNGQNLMMMALCLTPCCHLTPTPQHQQPRHTIPS